MREAGHKTGYRLAFACTFAGLATAPCAAASLKVEPYVLNADAHSPGPGKVELDISTNIPGTIAVMANIGLRNQKGDDLYVGTDNEEVRLTHGSGKIVFDVSKLPRGKYEAEIGFYLNWGFKDAASRASGITHDIELKKPIEFVSQSTMSAQEQIALKNKRIWVIDHALPETPWKPSLWTKRFGMFVDVPLSDEGWNPKIVKDYYFKSIDMRVRVNIGLHQIMGFEDGRGTGKTPPPAFVPKSIDIGMMTDLEPVVEDAVRRQLKSPDDARFDGLFGKLTGESSAIVCGNVNARNGFGGYVGNRSFVSMVSWGNRGLVGSASTTTVFADGTAAFRKIWKECR